MGNRRFEEASAGRYRDGSTRVIFQAGTERYTVLWNNTFSQQTIEIPAEGRGAQIHAPGGQVISLAPVAGGGTPTPNATAPDLTPEPAQVYRVVLPPAEPDNVPDLPAGEVSGIGGPAFILVERVAPNSQPETFPLASTPRFPITITPGALVAQPTAEPANDTQPPNTDVDTLPVVSEPAFTVRWRAWDDGAIEKMMVWVRVDGGEWQPWLETSRTEAVYTGAPGHTYEFAVWAVDAAGNWSLNTDLQPQAVTRVE